MHKALAIQHDQAHEKALGALDKWTRAYLAREDCSHCYHCPHVRLEHHIQDAYISIQCHHPTVLAQVRFGVLDSVLEHDPASECPILPLQDQESYRSKTLNVIEAKEGNNDRNEH